MKFLLAVLLIFAAIYGHDSSMTEEGFIVQGYLGAAVPVILAAFCAAIGWFIGGAQK